MISRRGMRGAFPARDDTIHFNVGNVGAPTIAPVAGVASPAAMATFGQLNIRTPRLIAFWHIHLTLGAAGNLGVELWRQRAGVLVLLDTNTAVNPSNFSTDASVPADRTLQAGDYLFAQAISATAIGAGADGLTVDIHFA